MFEHKDKLNGEIQGYASATYDGLVKAVVAGRNKLGKKDTYNKVWNELKRVRAKSSPITPKPKTGPKSVHDFRKGDVLKGIKAVFKTSVLNQTVSQGEILRRGKICEKCPKRQLLKGCMACGAGKAVAELFNESRKIFTGKAAYDIPVDLKKSNCEVCGCYLSTMLPAELSAFAEDTPKMAADRPAECWINAR